MIVAGEAVAVIVTPDDKIVMIFRASLSQFAKGVLAGRVPWLGIKSDAHVWSP